jgi:hypothetical protein
VSRALAIVAADRRSQTAAARSDLSHSRQHVDLFRSPVTWGNFGPYSAHLFNMNEVIAKRLGLYGGPTTDDTTP